MMILAGGKGAFTTPGKVHSFGPTRKTLNSKSRINKEQLVRFGLSRTT